MKKVFLLEPMRDKNLSHFCKFHLFLVRKAFWIKLPGRSLTLILLWQRYYDSTAMAISLSLCICWDEIFEPLLDYGYSLTDISFEYENQYLCIKNTIIYLCNDFYLISLYPSTAFLYQSVSATCNGFGHLLIHGGGSSSGKVSEGVLTTLFDTAFLWMWW